MDDLYLHMDDFGVKMDDFKFGAKARAFKQNKVISPVIRWV